MTESAGVPTLAEYATELTTPLFREMEAFSDAFLARHQRTLRPYRRRWVPDPLHQWSRQWEYPFAYRAVETLGRTAPGPRRVLDAGSGATFFPYFLQRLASVQEMHCCDSDADLGTIFDTLNRTEPPVTFRNAELADLPYPDGHFGAVCCISVLEHVADPSPIVAEITRVLEPGGELVLSVDIAVDERRDSRWLSGLASSLAGAFPSDALAVLEDPSLADRDDVLTTGWAARHHRHLLPWRLPSVAYQLSCLASGHGWVSWPPRYTVACFCLRRPGGPYTPS